MEPPGEETKEEPHWELDDKARALAKQQEIAEREADEQRRQQELISAYAHSVGARDAGQRRQGRLVRAVERRGRRGRGHRC